MVFVFPTFEPLFQLLLHRAQNLVPLVALAFFLGEYIARFTGTAWLLRKLQLAAQYLNRKLDRPKRSIATRIYRGMIATGFLVIPALALGLVLNGSNELLGIFGGFVLVSLLGHAFASIRLLNEWRAAHAGTLKLELKGQNYLFADSHAVLRHLILTSGEQFAVGVVGTCFWFILGGLPALFVYLTLGVLAATFRTQIFGWAANGLFQLLDFIPRAFTTVLLTLGALFTPRAKPFAAFKARSYQGLLSYLLNVSLGGRTPTGDLPWTGTGTPKLLPEHLARWMLVRVGATVLLVFALSAETILKLLHNLH